MPAASITPSATALVDALGVASGILDDTGRRIALATYRLLATGAPVSNAQIAADLDVDVDEVETRFAEWPGVFRNSDDAVVGFWGLAIRPLDPEYRLRDAAGDDVGYAWCAWDTLFLPTLLDQPLQIEANDGLTGEKIELTVRPDGVASVEPASTVVSFLAPIGPWEADIITAFCHKVIFFGSQANADEWIAAQRDQLFTLSVDDAFDVGRSWITGRYADALT